MYVLILNSKEHTLSILIIAIIAQVEFFAYPENPGRGLTDRDYPIIIEGKWQKGGFRKMNKRQKGAVLSYINTFVQIFVSLVYVPILLRSIGDQEYGLYQLLASIIAYLSVMETSLSASIMRFYCKYKSLGQTEEMENTLGTSRLIFWGITAVIAAATAVIYVFFEPVFGASLGPGEIREGKILLILLMINVMININNYNYVAVINANEQFAFLKLLGIVSQLVQPLVVLIVIRHAPYALTVVIIQVTVNLMVAVLRQWYARVKLRARVKLHRLDKKLMRSMLIFSAGIILAAAADQIFWKTDQIILGQMYGTAIVAVYSIGSQIYLAYMPLGMAVSSVFMPRLSGIYENEHNMEKISELFIKVGRITFYVLALVLSGFFLYGKEFIRWWAGDGMTEAYYVAIIVMVPFTIDLIQNLGLTILQVVDKYAFRAKIYFLVAVLNILTTILLAKQFAGIGAAVSTGVSMFVGSGLIMNWYYGKKIGLNIAGFWKNIAPIALGTAAAAALGFAVKMIFPAESIFSLILQILLYCIIYAGAMWIGCLNQYEREIVRKILGKLKRRH